MYSLIVLIILFLYIYYIQYDKGDYDKIFLNDLVNSNYLKTGDIITFKAYNNFNSVIMGNYYSHIGIIYIDPDDEKKTPLLFEANGVEKMYLMKHHNKNGIFLSPVKERIEKYKGRAFYKRLNDEIDDEKIKDFKHFIDYCLENMSYDYNLLQSALKKKTNIEKCGKLTNCGELVFLSLIKLGLFSMKEYNVPCFHYLKWVSNIKELPNGNSYNDQLEIVDHSFKY